MHKVIDSIILGVHKCGKEVDSTEIEWNKKEKDASIRVWINKTFNKDSIDLACFNEISAD